MRGMVRVDDLFVRGGAFLALLLATGWLSSKVVGFCEVNA